MMSPLNRQCFSIVLCFYIALSFSLDGKGSLLLNLRRLKRAYPEHIKAVSRKHIIWQDGTVMPVDQPFAQTQKEQAGLTLADQVQQPRYKPGKQNKFYAPADDSGRIRYEPFFRKMYGNSAKEVESNLERVDWMQEIFGAGTYGLKITTIHNLQNKIKRISRELEELVAKHPEFRPFLDNPGKTYCWRTVAHTNCLSSHSFGIAIDINPKLSNYWQWDLAKEGRAINEQAVLVYSNKIPWEIVRIFEKYGFIWGGKWYHYDTMHFEYRPELF